MSPRKRVCKSFVTSIGRWPWQSGVEATSGWAPLTSATAPTVSVHAPPGGRGAAVGSVKGSEHAGVRANAGVGGAESGGSREVSAPQH
jgi:hypothetical protein